jgi:hypothetical protein
MQEISLVSFSGVFALRDGVSEKEFLPRLHSFFQHFIDMGFATGYRVMRREALDGFGKTLPAFTYRVNSSIQIWSGSMPRTNTSNNMASR